MVQGLHPSDTGISLSDRKSVGSFPGLVASSAPRHVPVSQVETPVFRFEERGEVYSFISMCDNALSWCPCGPELCKPSHRRRRTANRKIFNKTSSFCLPPHSYVMTLVMCDSANWNGIDSERKLITYGPRLQK
jgi:hypothetical protein